MECSQEVALDQVLRRLVDSSKNRRFRGALGEYVKRTRRKITRLANVTVVKKHSVSFQSGKVHFRTTPVEVVHGHHHGRRQATLKSYRKIGSNKSDAPGDQNPHVLSQRGHYRETNA